MNETLYATEKQAKVEECGTEIKKRYTLFEKGGEDYFKDNKRTEEMRNGLVFVISKSYIPKEDLNEVYFSAARD